MNMSTNMQSATVADMAAELGRLEAEIATASHLVDTRELPQVSGLLPRISAVCQALAVLPRAEARSHLETVRHLLDALDGLAGKLAENHAALRQQLAALGRPPEHP